jgi:glutathione S-transferase
MITLYHAPLSRSARIRWLLDELGLEHRVVTMNLRGGDGQKPEYLAKNPLGTFPTIEIDGVVMFESGAIVEWLIERHAAGRLAPAPGAPDRARYLQWLHWGEATLLPPLSDLAQHSFVRPEAERIPAVVPDAVRRLRPRLGALEKELTGRDYLLGAAFSGADVMVGYGLQLAKLLGQLGPDFPRCAAYLERLSARPAFQKAFAG